MTYSNNPEINFLEKLAKNESTTIAITVVTITVTIVPITATVIIPSVIAMNSYSLQCIDCRHYRLDFDLDSYCNDDIVLYFSYPYLSDRIDGGNSLLQ